MVLNLLLLPTLLGAALFFLVGLKVALIVRSPLSMVAWFATAVLVAVPSLLFVVCYAHLLDRAAWYYGFRAATGSELTASGVGLLAGLMVGKVRRASPRKPVLQFVTPAIALLCLGVLLVPYLKPVIAPIRRPLHDEWSQQVCLQSSSSTCGPASAATLLRRFGISVSERELARECFSYRGGTENWYVARALRQHGVEARYLITSPEPAVLPFPSMAGVQMGGSRTGGHFITVLGHEGDRTIIGDPLAGKLVLTPQQLRSRYYFTGFFLVASHAAQ